MNKVRTRIKLFGAFTIVLSTLSTINIAKAHHSFAMFDLTRKETVAGTVTKVDFIYPHTWVYLTANDGSKWSIEAGSPNQLVRNGWKKNSIKAGDKVTFTVSPNRSGKKIGHFSTVKLADGQEFKR